MLIHITKSINFQPITKSIRKYLLYTQYLWLGLTFINLSVILQAIDDQDIYSMLENDTYQKYENELSWFTLNLNFLYDLMRPLHNGWKIGLRQAGGMKMIGYAS